MHLKLDYRDINMLTPFMGLASHAQALPCSMALQEGICKQVGLVGGLVNITAMICLNMSFEPFVTLSARRRGGQSPMIV